MSIEKEQQPEEKPQTSPKEKPSQTPEQTRISERKLEEMKQEDRETVKLETLKLNQEIEGFFGGDNQQEDSKALTRERKSSVTRIVGKDTAIPKEQIMDNIEVSSKNQDFQNEWKKESNKWGYMKEREKAPEELEIIGIVNDVTNQILEKYGLGKFDISAG